MCSRAVSAGAAGLATPEGVPQKRMRHTLRLTVVIMAIACVPRPPESEPATAQPTPVMAQEGCAVDLVNNTDDLVDVWYDPGQVSLGVLARNETIEFAVDCSHAVVRIYGRRNNPVAAGQGLGCATAEAWLRPGDVVMVSLNAPKVVPC